MRKALVLLLVVFVVTACGSTLANVTFGFDFGNGGVVCGGTVQKDCYDHFEGGTVSSGTGSGAGAGGSFTTLGSIPIPSTVAASGLTTVRGSFQVPNWGSVTLGVIMVAKDGSGGRVVSDPATASTVLRPGAPVNLTIQ